MEIITIDSAAPVAFDVDNDRRTMKALIVPWGSIGRHSNGDRWKFARGSLKYGHEKYIRLKDEHDNSQRLGRAVSAEDTDDGLVMTFRIDPGPAGDKALARAADGSKTGFSIEVEIDTVDFTRDPADPATRLVGMANLTGVGFVRDPAFNDSRLISVKASYEGGSGVPDNEDKTPEETSPAPQSVTLSDEQIDAIVAKFSATLGAKDNGTGEKPTVVVPPQRQTAVTEVTEALPYRFSYQGGKTVFRSDVEHDFSTDLFAAINPKTPAEEQIAARDRVDAMIKAAFAVTGSNVAAINPTQHRPDLWQPQIQLPTPLWDMVNSGSTDGTKFDVPQYDSSSGLVSTATPGTEPAPGAMQVKSQTITPSSVWGKVEIERQSWRAGGSPQFSGILWDQMLTEYYEDREAAVATFLATLTAAADVPLEFLPSDPTADEKRAVADSLEDALIDLLGQRGGSRLTAFAVHLDLYKALAGAKDDAGRPLYPQIAPANANGTTSRLWRTMDIGGLLAVPAPALGASGQTNSVNSWLFDPQKVRGWASAPERLDWNFGATVQSNNITQLAYVTVGIYGDIAFANLDINGVRQVTFDPVS